MSRPTIYQAAGGDPAFLALATAHHQRCLRDPYLAHPFSHADQNPAHVRRLAWYWAEVFGGPARFSQQCGGHSAMLDMHAHNGMEEELGRRFLACFVAAADDAGLPADPELRDALRDYMTWAVEDIYRYDPPDATVPTGAAMPHWSWDGLRAPV